MTRHEVETFIGLLAKLRQDLDSSDYPLDNNASNWALYEAVAAKGAGLPVSIWRRGGQHQPPTGKLVFNNQELLDYFTDQVRAWLGPPPPRENGNGRDGKG